ncbi:unnamed protein product [Gongylonema pulchrum]|uniref:DUF1127 domain-containing protein n=1 Tax=Gongylonema pulchrum TaxID=637853 RepID=A0A183D2N3_9BILA|nr:unnamed protein product [Gongylonema pulchrum]
MPLFIFNPFRTSTEWPVEARRSRIAQAFRRLLVFRSLDWNGAVKINSEQLNHLGFADEIFLIANSNHDVSEVRLGLNANKSEN